MNKIQILLLLAVTLNCLSLQTHDPQEPKFSSKLVLQFNYAVTDGVPFNSASFQVYWNDKLVADIKPNGYSIHTLSYELKAVKGRNVLAFQGTGISDGKGSAITNVKLLRKSSYGLQDLIDNGDFQSGWNREDRFRIFEGSIEGWKGKEIEVGNGQLYNRRWPKGAVVSELDADQNTRIQQVFYFLDNFQVFYQIPQQQFAI